MRGEPMRNSQRNDSVGAESIGPSKKRISRITAGRAAGLCEEG